MKPFSNFLFLLLLSCICLTTLKAQTTIPVTGGNATGSGGSASYTVGQLVNITNTGLNGTVSHGVQQPYEISVITAIQNTEGISLECTVYPNPTPGVVKLVVSTKDYDNLRYQLYDIGGLRLLEKKIDSEETEILMDKLRSSVYFLKVLSGSTEIKTFKIIKN
jgi:hypothetical protein